MKASGLFFFNKLAMHDYDILLLNTQVYQNVFDMKFKMKLDHDFA